MDEEDQLAAETGLLTLADFPDGWTEEPAEDESTSAGDEFERELGRCAGVEVEHLFDLPGAEAETGTFTSPDSMVTVDHEIEIPPNVDDVEAFITLLASESVLTCLQDVVPTFLEEEMSTTTDPAETLPSGTELGEVTVRRLDLSSSADDVVAYRMALPLTLDGAQFGVVLDLVCVRTGRAVAGLFFSSVLNPVPEEFVQQYVSLAASRLRTDRVIRRFSRSAGRSGGASASSGRRSSLSLGALHVGSAEMDALPDPGASMVSTTTSVKRR